MVTKVFESHIDAPVQKVWDFHNSAEALRLLTPPEQPIKLISKDNRVREGALHIIETKILGIKSVWEARITDVHEPRTFTDTALRSPFKFWKHVHEFIDEEGQTLLRDTITYEPKGGILSGMVNTLMVEDKVKELFQYRHRVTKEHVEFTPAEINEKLFAEHEGGTDSQLIS